MVLSIASRVVRVVGGMPVVAVVAGDDIPDVRCRGLRFQFQPGAPHTPHAALRLLLGATDVPRQLPLLHPQLRLRHSLLCQPLHR